MTAKKMIKETISVGMGSMAGMGAIGAMNQTLGMPANNVSQIAAQSMAMANVGQFSKNAIDVTKMMGSTKKKNLKW